MNIRYPNLKDSFNGSWKHKSVDFIDQYLDFSSNSKGEFSED